METWHCHVGKGLRDDYGQEVALPCGPGEDADSDGCHSPSCELPSGHMQQIVAGEKQAEPRLLQVGRLLVSCRKLEQPQ